MSVAKNKCEIGGIAPLHINLKIDLHDLTCFMSVCVHTLTPLSASVYTRFRAIFSNNSRSALVRSARRLRSSLSTYIVVEEGWLGYFRRVQ
jgi:hypothetical protein